MVRDVQVGEVLTEDDLGKASLALDPAVKAVRSDDVDSVVGKRAAVELKSGSLLAPSQVTKNWLVKAGEQLVPSASIPSRSPPRRWCRARRSSSCTFPSRGRRTLARRPMPRRRPSTARS
ncbi:SAF domain-containing protein [Streptomyces sp. Root1310]|uniref:SAF domain-containing protein n=1 Tax=Streptomyces sp. Root1310 TaxID=1736452 RepID=UPI001F5B43CB|nr:SAF domain-containing protein [Streptomyces sp. Root1310]